MRKIIIGLMLASTSAFAADVRMSFKKEPNYKDRSVCVGLEEVDGIGISGILHIKINGHQARFSQNVELPANGSEIIICAPFANNDIDDQVALSMVKAEFRDLRGSLLNEENHFFGTLAPNRSKVETTSPKDDAQIVLDRIATIKSCMRHEECSIGAIDSLDYLCVSQKISSISKLIQDRIPNSQYLVDALSFQCHGEQSLCSGVTYVDAGCVSENLEFVIKELGRIK